MIDLLYLFLAFLCGIVFNITWGYLLGLGYGAIAFRTAMIDTLLVLAKNIQSVYEIQQLKHQSYELLNRDEKYIEFQKQIDEKETRSLKNTIIRNYINSIPSRYNNMVQFHDWDSAMNFYNKAMEDKSK